MVDLLYSDETYRIRGAAFEVYKEMSNGYVEPVYQECMEKECRLAGIPFTVQQKLKLQYKGEPLEQTYRPDLICFDAVIVELKAVKELTDEHRAQVLNYLKSSGGFLVIGQGLRQLLQLFPLHYELHQQEPIIGFHSFFQVIVQTRYY